MRQPVFWCVLLAVRVWAQQMSIGSVAQKGICTVAGVTGNVTINCPGLDPSVVVVLNKQFNARLKERDVRIDQITKEANEWKDRFLDLTTRLADAGVNDGLQRKADELLKAGKLEEAGKVLDEIIAGEEKKVDQLAENHFNRASLFELQFKPLQALPHYEKAYGYRPNNSRYGQAYADLLYDEREFVKAEPIYKNVLEIRRELAKANPAAYLPDVALTLNNLGLLYSDTQRLKEAADVYMEAAQTYIKLEKTKPVYLGSLAEVMNNLGDLYRNTQRLNEAANFFTLALQTYRELAKANPQAYLPKVAAALNNLGLLYSDTQRLKQAEDAYTEALQIERELTKANPEVYLPKLGMMLNNLGLLYRDTQRLKQAEDAYTEVLQIRRQLAKANPQAYLPDVAAALNNLGNLYKSQGNTEAVHVCSEAAAIFKQLSVDNPVKYGPLLSSVCIQ